MQSSPQSLLGWPYLWELSSLWKTPNRVGCGTSFSPIAQLFTDKRIYFYTFHMCAFGAPYKKGTSILTNIAELNTLVRKCTGDHKHEQLRGTERMNVNGTMITRNKTVGAGAYPPVLCNAWAQACRSAAPAGAFGKSCWHISNQFLLDLWDVVDKIAGKSSKLLSGDDRQLSQEENPNIIFAKRYVKTHPVIFGQHSNAEAAKIRRRYGGKSQKNHRQAEKFNWEGPAKAYAVEGAESFTADTQQIFHKHRRV